MPEYARPIFRLLKEYPLLENLDASQNSLGNIGRELRKKLAYNTKSVE